MLPWSSSIVDTFSETVDVYLGIGEYSAFIVLHPLYIFYPSNAERAAIAY